MPRIVDHHARRQEIVHALWMVIHQQGIAAASLRTVAQEADISIGRIQHYFPSKESLVHEGCRALLDVAESQHLTKDSEDPIADLKALARHAIPTTEMARIAATVWCAYVAHVGADPVIAELVREANLDSCAEMARRCARARGRQTPTAQDAEDGRELSALGDGLMIHVLTGAIPHDRALAAMDRRVDSMAPDQTTEMSSATFG